MISSTYLLCILLADVKYGLRSDVTYTLGRLNADFIFDDSSLSRTHAEIKVSPKGEGVIIKGQAHDIFHEISLYESMNFSTKYQYCQIYVILL